MKMPLCTEVDLRAGHIVLGGFPALREMRTASPSFRPMYIVATVAHLSYFWAFVKYYWAGLEMAVKPVCMHGTG